MVVPPHPSLPTPSEGVGLAADIVRLLLAKLAEYIVPDATEVYTHVHLKQNFSLKIHVAALEFGLCCSTLPP